MAELLIASSALIMVGAITLLGVGALVWAKAITAALSTQLHAQQVKVAIADLDEKLTERDSAQMQHQPTAYRSAQMTMPSDMLKQAVVDAREDAEQSGEDFHEEADRIGGTSMYRQQAQT